MNKPLKRHEALKPVSREHHHTLMLCWKIREGLKNKVELKRIGEYCKFFLNTQLVPHFNYEEHSLFPLLGDKHPLVAQAIKEHREIEELFAKEGYEKGTLNQIEKILTAHIRFEERELFTEIQAVTNEETLAALEQKEKHQGTQGPEDWEDKFWL